LDSGDVIGVTHGTIGGNINLPGARRRRNWLLHAGGQTGMIRIAWKRKPAKRTCRMKGFFSARLSDSISMGKILRKVAGILEVVVIGLDIGDEYTPVTIRTDNGNNLVVYSIKDSATIGFEKDRRAGG
jgi:hypothetical protein